MKSANRERAAIGALWVFTLLALLFALVVWPNRWVYSVDVQTTEGGRVIRTNIRTDRFTGRKQSLIDGKWQSRYRIYD